MGRSEELDDDETTDDLEGTSEEQDSSEESDDLFDGMDVPPDLEDTKKNMQRAFTKKTTALANERKQLEGEVERLKQKAEMYDKLASDPEQAIEVLQRMTGKSSKNRADNLDDDDDDFADYGDNAESMKRLVKSITNKVTKSITQQMSPLIQNAADSSADKEMKSLSSWVESQSKKTGLDLPDPNMYEPMIKNLMSSGLTSVQAYKASINLDKLQVRKPVIKKKGQSTFQPGGIGNGKSSKIGFSTEDAIKRRSEGKRGGFSLEEIARMVDSKET
jgi:hypothetical protein